MRLTRVIAFYITRPQTKSILKSVYRRKHNSVAMETGYNDWPRSPEDPPARRRIPVTMFGKKVIPLKVHLIPYSPEAGEDEQPPRLCAHEEEAFFRCTSGRIYRISPMFDVKHSNNRAVPKVEPRSERQVFADGTLITITMHHVRKEDLLVQVKPRVIMVTGLVRRDAEGSSYPACVGRQSKSRLMYTYKTGVSEMMDLTSITAGYREGYIDLFLRRVVPL